MATGDLADFFASSASPAGFEDTGTGSLIVPGRRRTHEAVRRVRREASALVLWRARRTRARIGAKEVFRSVRQFEDVLNGHLFFQPSSLDSETQTADAV